MASDNLFDDDEGNHENGRQNTHRAKIGHDITVFGLQVGFGDDTGGVCQTLANVGYVVLVILAAGGAGACACTDRTRTTFPSTIGLS